MAGVNAFILKNVVDKLIGLDKSDSGLVVVKILFKRDQLFDKLLQLNFLIDISIKKVILIR